MSETNFESKKQGNFVNVNGLKLYYQNYGSGKSLIFLHGSMGTGNVWKPYVPTLSQDFNVILPDARGHGKTVNSGNQINPNLLADDIADFIDALDLGKPYLCGWSAGGDISLNFVIRYPDKISGLIVGGVTHRIHENYHASLKAMGLDGPGEINFDRAEENIPNLVALWKTEHTQSPTHWKDLITQLSYEMYNPSLPSDDDLEQIKVPTLIIWGDRDQFLPVENSVELFRLIPNAQLAVIPNADHFVTRTKIELFSDFVKDFISSITP